MKLRKTHSIAVLFALLFSLLLLPPPSYAVIRTVEGTITRVSDGDTIQVITREGTKLRIRLYGCDAPETEKINRRTGQISKPGQPYGEEALQALQAKVYRKKVRVDIIDIDRYRRMVSMIWLANRNVNLEMVREGYAEAYREYLKEPYSSKFIDAEQSDLFDVLAYVAYAMPPLTRDERAARAKLIINKNFNTKQQFFLDFVLAQYVMVGVDELDMEKLTPLLRLKYHDSIADAVADLGKPDEINKVFSSFQKYLYQHQAIT